MPLHNTLLLDGDETTLASAKVDYLQQNTTIFSIEDKQEDKKLENLVYRLARKPRDLLLHLQRIVACYRQDQSEQLYAALADFLELLSGKGRDLAKRMVDGAGSRLDDEQFKILRLYLNGQWTGHLPVNAYSVITDDLLGASLLVEKNTDERSEHDYLQLAHDYIEYSQLDSAMELLEEGVVKLPDRADLQDQLLELYQLTDNETRFRAMYASALKNNCHLISAWERLEQYFNGRKK